MKSFIVSISVILCLIGLTIGNAIYIDNVTSALLSEADILEVQGESTVHFSEQWEKHKPFIKISSSFEEVNRIDEAISVLLVKSKQNEAHGFYEEKALLIDYLTKIQMDETVSLDNIF